MGLWDWFGLLVINGVLGFALFQFGRFYELKTALQLLVETLQWRQELQEREEWLNGEWEVMTVKGSGPPQHPEQEQVTPWFTDKKLSEGSVECGRGGYCSGDCSEKPFIDPLKPDLGGEGG